MFTPVPTSKSIHPSIQSTVHCIGPTVMSGPYQSFLTSWLRRNSSNTEAERWWRQGLRFYGRVVPICWMLGAMAEWFQYVGWICWQTARSKSTERLQLSRVAGIGRLSAGAKMAMKPFVKRVFTIFATNASFLRVISNFRIELSKICNIYHVIVHFLPKKHCFYPKGTFFAHISQKKVRKSRQILIRDKIAYVRA